MFEKVNPSHPDKIADRIAGALVDFAYTQEEYPKVAVEVLIGHGKCNVIAETSVSIPYSFVEETVKRICEIDSCAIEYVEVKQNEHLANNQSGKIRCGDNGIFKGVPITAEQKELAEIVRNLYDTFNSDGKYIINGFQIIGCQSKADSTEIKKKIPSSYNTIINPLGYWTGGVNVDTGATNRKLGSDMGDAVTGGGLHGKDLSKADVAVNIFAHLKAQETGQIVRLCCAIGDEEVDGVEYSEIVKCARDYIKSLGGFEKLAEWGLI